MSEKGKKETPLPKAGKSAIKSTPFREEPLKGKNDSTEKSKRGRKVQFGAEGDRSKGEKGGKPPNSVRSPISTPDLNIEHELPKNSRFLMDCEAAHVLQGIQDQMVILSEDPTIKIPLAFDKGLQYAKTGSRYTSPHAVRSILESLKKHGVTDSEICLIANICPETVDEILALIPSWKEKQNMLKEPLKDVLSKLVAIKKS